MFRLEIKTVLRESYSEMTIFFSFTDWIEKKMREHRGSVAVKKRAAM